MDRKEFLRSCIGGACVCVTACVVAPPAAATVAIPLDDARASFAKRRYAKLLGLLSNKIGEEELGKTLHDLGEFCSSEYETTLKQYSGDIDGFGNRMKNSASGDSITYDRVRRVITMTRDRNDCFCPLNGVAERTPSVVCNCSMGWQQHSWEAVTQKKVRVELKETVLRGGQRCTFEIHILNDAV